ncbi:tryptophan-rich sensory protein [Erysipelotrichaceae bacterium RD49]|nr:tryptophan-rich sensory protein [Erysipelotrichaceae bacterium RD49]
MNSFHQMTQPPLSPPAWLFPVAWTILYILMGLASYLIWSAGDRSSIRRADARNWLIVYGISLFFNFCWSPVFFDLKWYWFALIWLLALWAMIIYLVRKARTISQPAMWAMVPYLLWVTFAAYLNAGIAILN